MPTQQTVEHVQVMLRLRFLRTIIPYIEAGVNIIQKTYPVLMSRCFQLLDSILTNPLV
jgi:hypothetical protein